MPACPHGWIRLIGQYAAAYFVKCFGTGKKRPRGGPPGKPPGGGGQAMLCPSRALSVLGLFYGAEKPCLFPNGTSVKDIR